MSIFISLQLYFRQSRIQNAKGLRVTNTFHIVENSLIRYDRYATILTSKQKL